MKLSNPYTYFNQYCLRTPLLPFSYYYNLIEPEFISDERIKKIWRDDIIKESIFIASPELFFEIEKWISNELKDHKKQKKLKISLLKYISRMSSRCTPFGLFAGCSIGEFSQNSKVVLEHYSKHLRHTRFDMTFLVALSKKIASEPIIKKQLKWYPNSSLYKIGKQYRYIESSWNENKKSEYTLEAVTHTPHISLIINEAKQGKRINELTPLLVNEHISMGEAEDFIESLIENQILVCEIEPTISGEDFFFTIQNKLTKLDDTEAIRGNLKLWKKFLDYVDLHLGNNPKVYIDFNNTLQEKTFEFESKRLFQTDMYPTTKINQLNKRVGKKIVNLLPLFNKISIKRKNSNLEEFKKAFVNRYETREVPLTLALDNEVGIGYIQDNINFNSGFLDDFAFYNQKANDSQKNYSWGALQEILYNRLEHNIGYELKLIDEDFENLDTNWDDLPDTLYGLFEIVKIKGREMYTISSFAGSAAKLLGRFSLGSQNIFKHIQNIIDVEQKLSPDTIQAEIIHLPESKTGNVIRRSILREYEIPYLGNSPLSKEKQIPIHDLMLSVRNNNLFLRSKKHNKEVLPRLTTAHNYNKRKSLPVYNFLCDIQNQNLRTTLGFFWGEMLEKKTFLPRVVYNDFILAKARWRITTGSLKSLIYKYSDGANILEEVKKIKSEFRLPKLVELVEGDNHLLINLDNNDSIAMWLDTIKNKKEFIFYEFLFEESDIVSDGNNSYTNQFVISLYNKEKLKSFNETF